MTFLKLKRRQFHFLKIRLHCIGQKHQKRTKTFYFIMVVLILRSGTGTTSKWEAEELIRKLLVKVMLMGWVKFDFKKLSKTLLNTVKQFKEQRKLFVDNYYRGATALVDEVSYIGDNPSSTPFLMRKSQGMLFKGNRH